jgi:carboxynorspermidine decarboxylase
MEKNMIDQVPSPCYVMEEALLRRNLALISRVAREAGVEIILAFKAFALWKSFPIFREYISSVTASSIHEARLAFEEFGSRAHAFSPAYTDEEFGEMMRCSSHISFNSLTQYERFYERTLSPSFPHSTLPIKEFLMLTHGEMPVVLLVDGDSVVQEYNYRTIDEREIRNFFNR